MSDYIPPSKMDFLGGAPLNKPVPKTQAERKAERTKEYEKTMETLQARHAARNTPSKKPSTASKHSGTPAPAFYGSLGSYLNRITNEDNQTVTPATSVKATPISGPMPKRNTTVPVISYGEKLRRHYNRSPPAFQEPASTPKKGTQFNFELSPVNPFTYTPTPRPAVTTPSVSDTQSAMDIDVPDSKASSPFTFTFQPLAGVGFLAPTGNTCQSTLSTSPSAADSNPSSFGFADVGPNVSEMNFELSTDTQSPGDTCQSTLSTSLSTADMDFEFSSDTQNPCQSTSSPSLPNADMDFEISTDTHNPGDTCQSNLSTLSAADTSSFGFTDVGPSKSDMDFELPTDTKNPNENPVVVIQASHNEGSNDIPSIKNNKRSRDQFRDDTPYDDGDVYDDGLDEVFDDKPFTMKDQKLPGGDPGEIASKVVFPPLEDQMEIEDAGDHSRADSLGQNKDCQDDSFGYDNTTSGNVSFGNAIDDGNCHIGESSSQEIALPLTTDSPPPAVTPPPATVTPLPATVTLPPPTVTPPPPTVIPLPASSAPTTFPPVNMYEKTFGDYFFNDDSGFVEGDEDTIDDGDFSDDTSTILDHPVEKPADEATEDTSKKARDTVAEELITKLPENKAEEAVEDMIDNEDVSDATSAILGHPVEKPAEKPTEGAMEDTAEKARKNVAEEPITKLPENKAEEPATIIEDTTTPAPSLKKTFVKKFWLHFLLVMTGSMYFRWGALWNQSSDIAIRGPYDLAIVENECGALWLTEDTVWDVTSYDSQTSSCMVHPESCALALLLSGTGVALLPSPSSQMESEILSSHGPSTSFKQAYQKLTRSTTAVVVVGGVVVVSVGIVMSMHGYFGNPLH